MSRRMSVAFGLIACSLCAVTVFAASPAKNADASGAAKVRQLLISSVADPDSGSAPLNVQFSAEVYEGDAAKKPRFVWDFGDRSGQGTGDHVKHIYKKAGKYVASVIVTDSDGRSGRDQLDIDVDSE